MLLGTHTGVILRQATGPDKIESKLTPADDEPALRPEAAGMLIKGVLAVPTLTTDTLGDAAALDGMKAV